MACSSFVRRWSITAAVVVLLAAGGILRAFVHPPTGSPAGADAVVVLAGDAGARLPVASRLATEGAGVLVVSVDDGPDNAASRALCEQPGSLVVHCFTAAESDTRAEARALGELVSEQGWDRIAVVTNSYHVVRAGVLVGRCTDAEVAMVDARADIPVGRWVVAIARELGGLAATAGSRSC